MSEAKTEAYTVISNKPTTTNTGSRQNVTANEIAVDFKHTFVVKAPLPKAAKSVNIHTTLMIWSSEEEGRIVRLQDRPDDDITDNSLISVGDSSRAMAVQRQTSSVAGWEVQILTTYRLSGS